MAKTDRTGINGQANGAVQGWGMGVWMVGLAAEVLLLCARNSCVAWMWLRLRLRGLADAGLEVLAWVVGFAVGLGCPESRSQILVF